MSKVGALTKMRFFAIVVCACLLLAGCSTGGKIDGRIIKDNIVIGKSTKADVLRTCGEPLGIRNSADNKKEIWHYAYVDKSVTGWGVFTHVIGVGTEYKSHKVVCDFIFENDIVIDYQMEEGHIKKMNYDL